MELPYSNLQLKHYNPGAKNPLVLPIHVVCNTSDEQIHENIRVNSRRPGKWLDTIPAHEGRIVICGSGPSLADNLELIRELKKAGAQVWALNGAARFLYDNGIPADVQLIIDAREETATLVGPAKKHWFASQVHPACFQVAPNAEVWHLQIEGVEDLFPDYEDSYTLIGGAASVGNTATCLAYVRGYRELHLFGYDSSHRDGKGHAFDQPMNAGDPCAWVKFGGKDYLTSLTMKLQAERFQDTARDLRQLGCKIHVHGTGLLPDMFNAPTEVLSEAEKYTRMWEYRAYRSYSPGEHCVDKFLELVGPKGRVIDFGCGTGRAGLRLKAAGLEVLLMDFTQNSRDYEAMVLPFMLCDLTRPIQDTADYGFCTDVMEHIPTTDVNTVLGNMAAAVGTLFLQISTVPDVMGAEIGQDLHLTVRPHAWWKDVLSKHGTVEFDEDKGEASLFLVKTK